LLVIAPVLLAHRNGLTRTKGLILGSAMLPMSTLSILFLGHATDFYPALSAEISHLLSTTLLVTYSIGPLATWWAMRFSGEAKPNA
jgi:hypothetical protein